MDSVDRLKTYLATYDNLDSALQDANESEERREDKYLQDLFIEDQGDKSTPSYYQEEESSDSDTDYNAEHLTMLSPEERIDKWEEDLPELEKIDDDILVTFPSWTQPVIKENGGERSLSLFPPVGLTQVQTEQWKKTIETVCESSKYWNLSECQIVTSGNCLILRGQVMTSDCSPSAKSKNSVQSSESPSPSNSPEHASRASASPNLWDFKFTEVQLISKRAGVKDMTVKLTDFFESEEEYYSVCPDGASDLMGAIVMGLKHKKLFNQARMKYRL
uniref:Phosphoprotein n=1 Tax=Vesicular stomatitis New Jersey virus TaxID=11280 RepID=I7CGJ5_9RHAB|nr:phosphoprotein [Vesicular stomatitis virus]AFO67813.1 phosphoprotein [Vesicular stomatitis New Jersey virus]